jgi:hypothetical protein
MTKIEQLEVLDDPTVEGMYAVELTRNPTIVHDPRMYSVMRWANGMWWERRPSLQKPFVPFNGLVLGWAGPMQYNDIEVLEDPPEFGFYAIWHHPFPTALPAHKEMEIAVWLPELGQKRGRWWDNYGWNRHHGLVDGWIGPLPMLSRKPMWLLKREEGEDIGL